MERNSEEDILDLFKPKIKEIFNARGAHRTQRKIANLFGKHPIAYHFVLGKGVLENIKVARQEIVLAVPDPIVYYFGIGNVEKYNIDIITPFITTNFKRMIATDALPATFETFKRVATLELGLLKGVNAKKIIFEKLSEDKFRIKFFLRGWREVIVYYNFDATLGVPPELNRGYSVLYTRRTGIVFFRIKPEVKKKLIDLLIPRRGFIVFQEIVHGVVEAEERKKQVGDSLDSNFSSLDIGEIGEGLTEVIICFRKT